jgi:methylenetetrahydrofolate reductase (NADPH)
MGVCSLLCLTGDGVQAGDHPQAKPVFDFDSISLLRSARRLREEGKFESGRPLTSRPLLFLGAAENPFVPPYDWRPRRLAQKIAAGAQFIQTQYCFDVPRLRQFLTSVEDQGLLDQIFILVGIGPLPSAKTAEWLRRHVPGVHIPDAIVDRLAHAQSPRGEGRALCVELIQELREIKGVSGVHLMAYRQEEAVAEVIDRSGVLAGRRPWYPGVTNETNRKKALS